jgi:hypothetical protein
LVCSSCGEDVAVATLIKAVENRKERAMSKTSKMSGSSSGAEGCVDLGKLVAAVERARKAHVESEERFELLQRRARTLISSVLAREVLEEVLGTPAHVDDKALAAYVAVVEAIDEAEKAIFLLQQELLDRRAEAECDKSDTLTMAARLRRMVQHQGK